MAKPKKSAPRKSAPRKSAPRKSAPKKQSPKKSAPETPASRKPPKKAVVKPKPAAGKSSKSGGDDRWWDLIARSAKGAEGPDEQGEKLETLVKALELADIVDFDRFVQERIRDAFRSDLWAVAYIMNGGCSDDGFDYFLGWLVGRGKKHYEAALANPEAAARGVDPDDEPFENEAFYYVPRNAYEAKTGKEGSYEAVDPNVTRTLKGEIFDEDTVAELHPKLAKRFNG